MTKIKLLTTLAITLSFSVSAQTKVDVPNDWKNLSENNYSIQYPTDWELNQSGQMGMSFIFLSPLTSEKDQFRENVNLLIQDLTGHNLDLNKYAEISVGQIKTMITDGKIFLSEKEKAHGMDYQKVIYTGSQGIYDLQFEQYYWVKDEKAYILTLTCEKDQFQSFKKTGEQILNSFILK